MSGTLVASTINAGASASLLLQSNNTTALTLDTSQNVTAAGTVAMASSFKRNRIINGNMAVSQRGTTFTSPSGYMVDRWALGYTGSAPASAAQVAGPTGYKYALQITGAPGNTLTVVYQRVESLNCADLSGNSVTISAVIFGSTAQTVGWNLLYPSAVDNFTTATSIQTGSWSATTSAQTFTATITGLPAGVANGLQLNIYPQNGGAFTSGTVNITGVQLEVGTKATPYEMQIYSDQLAQCQRYYTKLTSSSNFATWGNSVVATSSTIQAASIRLPVTMRSNPTITFATVRVYDGSSASAISSITGSFSGPEVLSFDAACSPAVLTAYRPGMIQSDNSTAGYIAASAEL